MTTTETNTIENATENGLKPTEMFMSETNFEDLKNEFAPVVTAENDKAAPMNIGKGRHGFRNVGMRKLNLVNELSKALAKLERKGINTDFVLKKFTSWKGPIRTRTKDITGIIAQVKEFENA